MTIAIESRVEGLLAKLRAYSIASHIALSDEEIAFLRQRVPKGQMRTIDNSYPELWARLQPLIQEIYAEAVAARGDEGGEEVLLISPYPEDGFVVQIAIKHALLPDNRSRVQKWLDKLVGGR
jgi:hypothetical protein